LLAYPVYILVISTAVRNSSSALTRKLVRIKGCV